MYTSIGIWGYGIVGKSAASFFSQRGISCSVYDQRELTLQELDELSAKNITFYPASQQEQFLEQHEKILPSPGIDLAHYQKYAHKWISELDIFATFYQKPIIAVTGSIGKTSVTHLLYHTLKAAGVDVALGGNIGIGMLDILQEPHSIALLEVSSFQLDLSTSFAPKLALWTNFHANHLDRHGSLDAYLFAKYKTLLHQTATCNALLPLELLPSISRLGWPKSTVSFFSLQAPTDEQRNGAPKNATFYYATDQAIVADDGRQRTLIFAHEVPDTSFFINWILIAGALDILNISCSALSANPIQLPEHRLEKLPWCTKVTVYNDSKSTTPAATLAALDKLHGAKVHLFLGGISKGIDRSPLIAALKHQNISWVYCFGKESNDLKKMCQFYGIASSAHDTLEQAFKLCLEQLKLNDVVLFSPAGASFDLFKDYQERGKKFKELVKEADERLSL